MSDKTIRNKSIGLMSVALAGIVLSGSAFAVQQLPQGYMLAASHTGAEGKCGEGQCGDAIFNAIDTDDDARISRAEFLVVEPKGQAVFAKKDTNTDGYIDEMESYLSVKAAYNENGKELPNGLFSTKE